MTAVWDYTTLGEFVQHLLQYDQSLPFGIVDAGAGAVMELVSIGPAEKGEPGDEPPPLPPPGIEILVEFD